MNNLMVGLDPFRLFFKLCTFKGNSLYLCLDSKSHLGCKQKSPKVKRTAKDSILGFGRAPFPHIFVMKVKPGRLTLKSCIWHFTKGGNLFIAERLKDTLVKL